MLVRLLSTAALAGGVLAAPTSGPPASTTTLKYKVGVVAQATADLSVMGGGEQKNNSAFTGFFTMTLDGATGGQALTVVLDSMVVDSATMGLAVLKAAADSARGASWTGLLTDQGKIENLTVVNGAAGAQQFENVLAGFFPRGAAHTRKKGEVWTDTLTFSSTGEAMSSNSTVLTTFTAAGEGMYANAKALTINSTSTSSTSVTQEGPGGDMQIQGSGKGVGVYYVTKEGRYLGGTNTLDSDMTITTPQAPVDIPLKAHTVITVSSL